MKWPVQWTGHNPITNTHSLSLSSLCVLGCGGGLFVRAENCYRAALDIWIDSSLALPWFPVDVTVMYSVQLHLPSPFVFSSPPCLCKHISTGACIKQQNSFYPSYCWGQQLELNKTVTGSFCFQSSTTQILNLKVEVFAEICYKVAHFVTLNFQKNNTFLCFPHKGTPGKLSLECW